MVENLYLERHDDVPERLLVGIGGNSPDDDRERLVFEIDADVVVLNYGEHFEEVGGIESDGAVFAFHGSRHVYASRADFGISGGELDSSVGTERNLRIEIVFFRDEFIRRERLHEVASENDALRGCFFGKKLR